MRIFTFSIQLSFVFYCFLLIPPAQAEKVFKPDIMFPQTSQSGRYFNFPKGIARDKAGNFYITDAGRHRIKVLNEGGELLRTWGGFGSAPGLFNDPIGIVVSEEDEVFVVDSQNGRIQVFDTHGRLLRTWDGSTSVAGKFNSPFGIVFGPDELVYVSDTLNFRIVVFSKQGEWRRTIAQPEGNVIPAGEGLLHPRGLAFNSEGLLFVAEGDNRHQISVFDLQDNKIRSFGGKGSENGQFDTPVALAFDQEDNLYVGDLDNHRIQVFNKNDQWLHSISFGEETFRFIQPFGLSIDKEEDVLYVVNTIGHEILRYSLGGKLLGFWTTQSEQMGKFSIPKAKFSPWGEIYVVDEANNRVQVFNQQGGFLFSFGETGRANDQLFLPTSVAFDDLERVYVSDLGNNRIKIFDRSGNYLTQWGWPGENGQHLEGPTDIFIHNNFAYVTNHFSNKVQIYTVDGQWVNGWGGEGGSSGQFSSPIGVVVDSSGTIFVSDRGNHRIQTFDSQGKFLREWGGVGTANGELNRPMGLGISSNDLIYVADALNNRVQVFQTDGAWVETIGGAGTQPGQFGQPFTVSLLDDDTIVVSEFAYNRIQLLRRKEKNNIAYKGIILAGGGPSEEGYHNHLWDSTQLISNNAFFALRSQGFDKENVKYLTAGNILNDLDENGLSDDMEDATLANLQKAITEWAGDAKDVLLYLSDHGGPETFKINRHEVLGRKQLTDWLDELQQQITGKITLVIEACQSASFFDGMGRDQRVLVASASRDQPAVLANGGSHSFSYFFWSEIRAGATLQEAFKFALQAASSNTILVKNQIQKQKAQLDANANDVFDEDDYAALGDYCLGECKLIQAGEPQVIPVTKSARLDGDTRRALEMEVTSLVPVVDAWVIVSRPDQNYIDLNTPISDLPKVDLQCTEKEVGQYHCQGEYAGFDANGDYYLTFHARDNQNAFSLPSAVIKLTQKGGKDNPLLEQTPTLQNNFDGKAGLLNLVDVQVSGEHFQATLLLQQGQFIIQSVGQTSERLEKPAQYFPGSRMLIIPEVFFQDRIYEVTLQLAENSSFNLITVVDLREAK